LDQNHLALRIAHASAQRLRPVSTGLRIEATRVVAIWKSAALVQLRSSRTRGGSCSTALQRGRDPVLDIVPIEKVDLALVHLLNAALEFSIPSSLDPLIRYASKAG
jgi:hypothetical protein